MPGLASSWLGQYPYKDSNFACRDVTLYITITYVIKTWKHKGLKTFFETGSKKGINAQQADRIRRILDALDAASIINELNLPTFDLHELKGDRKGTWSITVVKNWRITFKFIDGNAYEVNYEDYH